LLLHLRPLLLLPSLLLLLPQVLLSFMPDLESAWLCSIIGAAMSLGYSFIAVALGAAQVRTVCCMQRHDLCN
jgi:hypothetical protein